MVTNHEPATPFAELLSQRGLTNRKLASLLGTGEAHVSRWRNGLRPGPDYRKKMIRKLDLTETEIGKLGWPEANEAASV